MVPVREMNRPMARRRTALRGGVGTGASEASLRRTTYLPELSRETINRSCPAEGFDGREPRQLNTERQGTYACCTSVSGFRGSPNGIPYPRPDLRKQRLERVGMCGRGMLAYHRRFRKRAAWAGRASADGKPDSKRPGVIAVLFSPWRLEGYDDVTGGADFGGDRRVAHVERMSRCPSLSDPAMKCLLRTIGIVRAGPIAAANLGTARG